jgi:hypothetical protein
VRLRKQDRVNSKGLRVRSVPRGRSPPSPPREQCSIAADLFLYLEVWQHSRRSVEEAEDLSSDMLGTSLVVVHDTLVGGEDEHAELTGWEDSVGEVLELFDGQIETG